MRKMKYIWNICISAVGFHFLFLLPVSVYAEKMETIHLTPDQAIALALANNRSLLNSAGTVESRELSLLSSRSEFDLKIIPSTTAGITDNEETFGASVSLEKKFSFGPRAVLSPGIITSSGTYSGKLATAVSIPLLRGWGKSVNEDTVRYSQFSLRTAERNLYLNRVGVVLDTVSAFYGIVKQQELLRLFDAQVKKLSGHAQIARIKEKVGLATPIDIYRAEIRMKDVEDQREVARENLQDVKDRLRFILSLPLDRYLEISADIIPEKVRITPEQAMETAMKNRIELEQSEDEMQEAQRQSEIARHNILPQLDLLVEYDRFSDSEEIERSLNLGEDRWSFRIVSATDLARTSEKTNYRQSLINIRTSKLNQQTRQEEIRREIRRQMEFQQKAEERMKIRQEQIQQAQSKLALAKIKFDHSMADNFDVIEAETELRQARVNLLSVQTDYIVGTYRMRAVLGTLLER